MHWDWNPAAGYKFLLLEGRVDDDGDGLVDDSDPAFVYHCATDAAMREAQLGFTGTVAAGGTLAPRMEIHIDLLVAGVDMLTNQMGMGYEPVNVQLMDNLVNALKSNKARARVCDGSIRERPGPSHCSLRSAVRSPTS